jgi:hypothetical protein
LLSHLLWLCSCWIRFRQFQVCWVVKPVSDRVEPWKWEQTHFKNLRTYLIIKLKVCSFKWKFMLDDNITQKKQDIRDWDRREEHARTEDLRGGREGMWHQTISNEI